MAENTIKIKCLRYDPGVDKKPRYKKYKVPLQDDDMSVHDCLEYIRNNLDPSLAYFINCRHGFCLRCSLRVNGKVVLACETRADGDMTLEPVNMDTIIRDLWCEST